MIALSNCSGVNDHPYTITRLWVSSVNSASRFEMEPNFVSDKFKERLLRSEKALSVLCEFTGINFESGMLSVPQVDSSMGTDQLDKIGIDGEVW